MKRRKYKKGLLPGGKVTALLLAAAVLLLAAGESGVPVRRLPITVKTIRRKWRCMTLA